MDYNHIEIEKKWQKKWEETKQFKYEGTKSDKEKYYILEMFPYPSGKLHMGHVRNYSIGDVIARFQIRNKKDVLHPIGWDAFGLPAENAAIENKTAPAKWTYANIKAMQERFKQLGISYDWDREIATCTPEYYRWEQQFFIEMFEKGLAYKKNSEVNWCPQCNTVLANEQVVDGTCWRHGCEIEKRKIQQWYFKITDYAEELLQDLDKLKGWPENVKEMQRNWIGKSEGTFIDFKVENEETKLTVFTTRPDTLMGVTFASMSVDHDYIEKILQDSDKAEEMKSFIKEVKELQSKVRDDNYEKKGFFTGKYLIHPITEEKVPLYLANFVVSDYGTGVVMAVPAHDQRDFDFAKKYDIPIKIVIKPKEKELEQPLKEAFTEKGILVNSGQFDGIDSQKAKKEISEFIKKSGKGKVGINYRLRDWGISRQRYWGTPIPIVYCEKCGIVPEKKENLPVILPENVEFSGATSPLVDMPEFYETTCPKCGGKAKRETDTMDTFVESSWYHMKYTDPKTTNEPFSKAEVNRAMPVDQYIGGVEHAVMHLLYTRFFTKVLADLGYVDFREPVQNLLTQGMVCMESYKMNDKFVYPEEVKKINGEFFHKETGEKVIVGRKEKMSKSKKNVVDPVKIIEKYGADTARLFVLFASPPEKDLEWSEEGIEGCNRFLKRVWNIVEQNTELLKTLKPISNPKEGKKLFRKTHQTIKKVREDIDRFHFNTAISATMELVNEIYKFKPKTETEKSVLGFALKTTVSLLNPFAPHLTEELNEKYSDTQITNQDFPTFDEKALIEEEMLIIVQVNGKVRDRLTFSNNATKEEVENTVKQKGYEKYLKSGEIKKIIYVPKKIVNIVG